MKTLICVLIATLLLVAAASGKHHHHHNHHHHSHHHHGHHSHGDHTVSSTTTDHPLEVVPCSYFKDDCFSCARGFDHYNHTVHPLDGAPAVALQCRFCPASGECSSMNDPADCEEPLQITPAQYAEMSQKDLDAEAARVCPCTTAVDCEDCTATGECGWCASSGQFNNHNGSCMLKTNAPSPAPVPEGERKAVWHMYRQQAPPSECEGMWIDELKCPAKLFQDVVAMASVMFLGFFLAVVALAMIVGMCCAGLCMVLTIRIAGPRQNKVDPRYANL